MSVLSIPFDGFTGPGYQLDSRYAAIERTVNWLCVPNETAEEKKYKVLHVPAPGNKAFSPLPVPVPFNQPCRGLLELRGVAYGVNGNIVYWISSTGVYSQIGVPIMSDGLPVSMVANGNGQIFIASAGIGYVIKTSDASLSGPFAGSEGASCATFQDGYILAIVPNSNKFQISGNDSNPIGDATIWDGANVSVQAGQADKLRAIISSREYVRLLGARRSQIYYDVGNNILGGFPFQSYNETFIETGIAAVRSLADLGDSLIWIGEDARGMRACWRDQAFQPQRVSNFAVEQFWQGYSRIDDAVAFPFIWNGHLLYQVTFPSANVNQATGQKLGATWIYDVTASAIMQRPVWTERAYQSSLGYSTCRAEQFHCFCYGLHLVGSAGQDGNPGAIYQYAGNQYTDCGAGIDGTGQINTANQVQQNIVRDRIAPHIWQNNKRIIISRIELECARGVGLDGGVQGSNPLMVLRWSKDGGNTWGAEQEMQVGAMGQYGTRVLFNRLGYGRDWAFHVRYSDPTFMSISGAELDLTEMAS